MKLWRVLSIVVVSSVLGGGARAAEQPDPAALAAAKDLCAVITKDTLKQMSTQMSSLTWPGIEKNLRAKQTVSKKQIDSLRQEFDRIQIDFLTEVMAETPAIYARHFTAGELHEMLAFYRTPVGQKSLKVLPQVMTEIMAVIMPRMPQVQKDVMDAFGKVLHKQGLEI
ncbi:MAG TPA: DUF2059 domain-containing protein [Polyangia bacterium]|nr:DUF2059 domain-containing protein [Polyangia bacterium]